MRARTLFWLVLIAMLGAVAEADGSFPSSRQGATAARSAAPAVVKAPSGKQLAQLQSIRRQQRRAAARLERRRNTPRARAVRRASRSRYRGLDSRRALGAIRKTHERLLERPTNHPPRLRRGERIVDYLTPMAALVRRDGVRRVAMLEAVGAPIAADPPGGGSAAGDDLKPLDLDLVDGGSSFRPKLSAVELTLPKTGGAAATLGDDLALDVPGPQSPGRPVDGRKLFYGEALPDTDVLLEPAAAGLEVSWTLRSPASPETLPLGLRAANGKALRASLLADGSASVQIDGQPAAEVSPPVAWDAQGQPVEAKLALAGGRLEVAVPHARADVAYPIVVDPLVRYVGQMGFMLEDEGGLPTRIGWNFHTFQTDAFWRTAWNENRKGMAAVPGGAQGSAWQAYDPIRESSAFRVEFFGVGRDYGEVCITAGLYGRGGAWADSGYAAYWTSPNNPGVGGPNGAANSAFGNCNGPMGRTFVQVCATNCGWGGSSDNIVAFQMNTDGRYRPNPVGAFFDNAYVYHREITPPVISSISGLEQNWTRGPLSATISADDAGIGFCSDRNYYPDRSSVPDTLQVLPTDASGGHHGVAGVGGCTGMTYFYSAPSRVDLGWAEGQQGGAPIPEGIKSINFRVADMFDNSTVANRTVRIDRTAPTTSVTGRIGAFVTPRSGRTGDLPNGVRTFFGAADAVIEVKDWQGQSNLTTSGVATVAASIVQLDDAGNRVATVKTLFSGAVACNGQDNCNPVPSRVDPAEFSALSPGLYQLEIESSDRAGNTSVDVGVFAKGGVEITSVVEGQGTARWVPVQAARPGSDAIAATLRWRTGTGNWELVPGDALFREANGSKVGPDTVGVSGGTTGRYVLDLEELIRIKGALKNDRIELRADFDGSGSTYAKRSETVAIRLDRGGRDTSDAKADMGIGAVDKLTGNLDVGAVDAEIDGYQSAVTVSRTYGSRYSAATDNGLLGPGWKLSLPSDGSSDFVRVVDMDDPAREVFQEYATPGSPKHQPAAQYEKRYGAVRVETADGAGFVFERRESDGKYLPEIGFESFSLTRTSTDNGATTDSFVLTDAASGGVTTIGKRLDDKTQPWYVGAPEHGTFGVTNVDAPGEPGKPAWRYEQRGAAGQGGDRQFAPTRVTSSHDGSLSCALDSAMARGCRALDFTYEAKGTPGRQRLTTVKMTATDPATGQMRSEDLVSYAYSADAAARLTEVLDVKSGLATTYTYNAEGLLSSARVSGREPVSVTYQSLGTETPGRVRTVSRPALPGTATSTLIYDDRTFSTANPWDLSATEVAKWGQQATPYRALAVIPPDVTPATDQATLRKADISYLDALGREVNTASPGGRIDSTDFDKWGNVARELSSGGRAAALAATNTQDVANRRASYTSYEEDSRGSRRPIRAIGPERDVRLGSGSTIRGRSLTTTTYDEGIAVTDPKLPYSLPTTVRAGAVTGMSATGAGGTEQEMRVTKSEYQLSTRQPTAVTQDAGGWLSNVRRYVRDVDGREIERRQPKDPGTASAGSADVPTTTKTAYYASAGTASASSCGGRPEWVGLICTVDTGGAQPASGLRKLPSKRVEYDFWRRPVKTTETAVSSAGATETRATTQSYDAKERLRDEQTVGSAASVGAAVSKIRHVYDDATGDELETQQLSSSDAVVNSVKRTFDTLGRVTSYADANRGTTAAGAQTTGYDLLGRPSVVTESKGGATLATRTYTYDATTGLLTGLKDSGLSATTAMVATYDADNRPASVLYPSGLMKVLEYDEGGDLTRISYTKTTGCSTACAWYQNTVARSPHEQIVNDASTLGTANYGYDTLGRLTATKETLAGKACVTRSYTYDANANRTTKRSATAASVGATCPLWGTGGSVVDTTTDSSDRLQTANGYGQGSATVSYDAWGRTLTLPKQTTDGSAAIESTYFANDLARTLTRGDVTITNELDPLDRALSRTTATVGQTAQKTDTYAYGDDTDEPLFTRSTSSTAPSVESGWTRYVEDPTGDLAAQVTNSAATLQISNIRGDIVAEAPATTGATGLTGTTPSDEFGIAQATTGKSYAFLGAKQREALLSSSVIAMGVRTYSPHTGRFLQTDPVLGGSANTYDYTDQDPVNTYDLDGRCPWCVVAVAVLARAGASAVARRAAAKAVTTAAAKRALDRASPFVKRYLVRRGKPINFRVGVRRRVKIALHDHLTGPHKGEHIMYNTYKKGKPRSARRYQSFKDERGPNRWGPR